MTGGHSRVTAKTQLTPSRILAYIGSVAALRVVVKLAGFGEKAALAYYFDLDSALDAFTAALSVPMMFLFTVRAVTSPTILPMFIRRLQSGDAKGGWGQLHAWFLVFTVALGTAAVTCFVLADQLAWVLAPGFDEQRHALCVSMLRVMIPTSVLLGLNPLISAALNAQRRFLFPPLGEAMMKAVMIGALLLFAAHLDITVAVWATTLGAAAWVLVGLCGTFSTWQARGATPKYRDPDFRFVLFLMLAPGLGAVFSRLGNIVENAASSTLAPGSVAALELARKIVNMPLLIIPLASGTVLFTVFSELNQSGDHESASRILLAGVRAMLYIFLPIAILTCVLAQPIVAFVYERGAFGADSTDQVARVLFWLAPMMCALSIEALIMRHFFSRLDVWPPVLIGVVCVLLRILLIVALIGRWHLAGVAAGMVISRFAKITLLTVVVGFRGRISRSHVELVEMLKLAPAAVLAGAIAYAVVFFSPRVLDVSTAGRGTLLTLAGGSAAVVYTMVTYLLGCKECHYLVHQIARRMPRRGRSA